MTIRIVLADDHTILRQGLKSLLAEEHDIQILGETGDGIEALQLVERKKPDILVVDVMMPGMNGLEVTRQVKEHFPEVKIVVLSMHMKEAYVMEAIRNGASAYVLKDSQATDLISAIRGVMQGRRFLSPPLTERILDDYFQKASQLADPFDILTGRERQVFQLVAEGLTSTEIAAKLSIGPSTVDVYRNNIMQKLHLKNRTDLIRLAFKRGIISEEE
jgi:two-component system, NarL family, response regulator NreC